MTPELALVCPELRARALAALPERNPDGWLPAAVLPSALERTAALALVLVHTLAAVAASMAAAGVVVAALTLAAELRV